jgi:hypothetical protein
MTGNIARRRLQADALIALDARPATAVKSVVTLAPVEALS